MKKEIENAREAFKELLVPSKLYITDVQDVVFDKEYEYLTPEMVKIFRHSEVRSMQMEEEEEVIEEIVEVDFKTMQLKKILDKQFEKGLERKPVLWPVLPMSGI